MDPGSQFVFHLDQPTADTFTSRNVVFSGWCYHRGGEPIRGVRAALRKRYVEGVFGQPRPDVARHFHDAPGTLQSGFRIPLTVPAGTTEIGVEILWPPSGWVPLTRKTIICRPPSRFSSVLVWSRFAWRFRRSFREAWERLADRDQDALRQFLEARNLIQLGNLTQYAPRDVVLERFPRQWVRRSSLPRISIITPSFNQARYLRETMTSVLSQNYSRLDYIVVDGASTDGSVDVIKSLSPRLKYWTSESDAGQADALRKGFARLEGGPTDIVAYLNSDDLLLPGALDHVAGFFARHPGVDVVYGNRILVDEAGKEIGRWVSPRPDAADLRLVDYVPQETLFWRKRAHDRIGGIDSGMRFAMDWDLLLRLQASGAVIRRVPYYLGCFRVHPAQKTNTQIHDVGKHEMDALRRRSLGREPAGEEIAQAVERNRIESAILMMLLAQRIRV